MKSYVVGGAVRDRLLGFPVVDRDHVVVGATVDEMLAAGYKPVGRDFPVFLHPITREEYALARTERKVARGYSGFIFHADPTVTLEADLERRDLTINAMAEDEANGDLIDPFGGRCDLARRTFRHVGPAFAEDPVRLLRIARFAARFTDFTVAAETMTLMRRMTDDGEIDALVPERVWQEVARGLMEKTPSRMFGVLRQAGASGRLFPEVHRLFRPVPDGGFAVGPRMLAALDRAAGAGSALEIRFAILLQWSGGRDIESLCRRMAVPKAARDLALLAARERASLLAGLAPQAPPAAIAGVAEAMERGDASRRPARFLQAVEAIGWTLDDAAVRSRFVGGLSAAVIAAAGVDAGRIAREAGFHPASTATSVRDARHAAIVSAIGGSMV